MGASASASSDGQRNGGRTGEERRGEERRALGQKTPSPKPNEKTQKENTRGRGEREKTYTRALFCFRMAASNFSNDNWATIKPRRNRESHPPPGKPTKRIFVLIFTYKKKKRPNALGYR